jgi:hypothetical protein
MSNCRSHRYMSDGEGSQGIERIECCRVPQVGCWRVPQVHGDFYDEMQASRMSNYRSHRYTSDREGSHRMEKGPSEDFYDKLQASWMSNYRSYRYTSDGEGSHRKDKDRTETSVMNCKRHEWEIWRIRWVTIGPTGRRRVPSQGEMTERRLLWWIPSVTYELYDALDE